MQSFFHLVSLTSDPGKNYPNTGLPVHIMQFFHWHPALDLYSCHRRCLISAQAYLESSREQLEASLQAAPHHFYIQMHSAGSARSNKWH